MLQALKLLANADLQALGYNSAQYIHLLYQAMNLAFADCHFYCDAPSFAPEETVAGLLSKAYAKARSAQMNQKRNDAGVRPGDP